MKSPSTTTLLSWTVVVDFLVFSQGFYTTFTTVAATTTTTTTTTAAAAAAAMDLAIEKQTQNTRARDISEG